MQTYIENSIWQTLQKVKSTTKTTEKLSILTNFVKHLSSQDDLKNYNLFLSICQHVFDYQKVYFIKKIPAWEYKHHNRNYSHNIEHHLSENGIINQLLTRKITGNAAKDSLQYALETSSFIETSYLIKCIIDKTFDIGADHTTFAKAFGFDLVEEHKVSLCTPATEKLIDNFKYPAIGQLKYDAMRIEVDIQENSVKLITRPGKTILTNNDEVDGVLINTILPKIKELYASYGYNITGNRIHIDGEMVFTHNGQFLKRQISNGIANKVAKGTKEKIETNEIVFCSWDIITPEEKAGKLQIPYKTRLKILNSVIKGIPFFKLAETKLVENKTQAIELAIYYVKNDMEGCIIKDPNQFWTPERVKTQLKLKAVRECEMKIVGYNLSEETKYSGMVGSLITESEDGKVIANISGMSDADRVEFLDKKYIGKIITVHYNEITTNKEDENRFSLFLPRIVEIREDKYVADTYESIRDADFVVIS